MLSDLQILSNVQSRQVDENVKPNKNYAKEGKAVTAMKDKFVTITGMNHYYGLKPFQVGMKVKCYKEPENAYDSDAIKAVLKPIGTVGYIANSPYTTATGTRSASRIYGKVKKIFTVEVMFITGHSVICKVVGGLKEKKVKVSMTGLVCEETEVGKVED